MLISELEAELKKIRERHGDNAVFIYEWDEKNETCKKREISAIYFTDCLETGAAISFDR